MNVPTFERQQFVDKDGFPMPSAQQYLEQLTGELQADFSDEGLVVPPLDTVTINYVTSPSNPQQKPDGTLFYDTTTNQLKVKINGVVKVVQTL